MEGGLQDRTMADSLITRRRHKTSSRGIAPRNTGLFLWFAGGWAAILAIIFFTRRGNDAGKLLDFFSNAGNNFGAPRFSELGNFFAGSIAASLVALSWTGFGQLIRIVTGWHTAERQVPTALAWSVRAAWGAGFTSLLWLLLGLLHMLTFALSAVVLLTGLGLFAWTALGDRRDRAVHEDGENSRAGVAGIVVAMIPIALAAIAAAAPPTAKDALLYHISLPKAYLAANGIVDVEYNIAQYYALGAELNGTWAMLLGRALNLRTGEAAFAMTQFAYLPILAGIVYGWARRRGLPARQAMLPVALVTCVPTIYSSASSGYNDLALCVYVTLAAAAAVEWWNRPTYRHAAAIGLAVGFGLGIKLLALFILAPILIMFLARLRTAEHGANPEFTVAAVLKSCVVACGISLLAASPWFVRTLLLTGSPVYPFYINILHGSAPGWDVARSYMDQMLNASYGGYPKNLIDYLAVPLRVSLAAQYDAPQYFDGVLGISFLSGAAVLLYAFVKKKAGMEVKWMTALSAAFFFCWMFSSEQMRYLLPALPAAALAISLSAFAIDSRLRKVMWATVAPGLVVVAAWFAYQNPLPVMIGSESREAYLQRQLDYYPFYEAVNTKLPHDARVWLINMRRDTYHIERAYFSDFRIEDHTFTKLIHASDSVEELRGKASQAGITHVLARLDVLLDPRISPVVDDSLSPDVNDRKMRIARDFLLAGDIIMRNEKFVLMRI